MGRTVGIGIQDYGKVIENNYFYMDKTSFIKEWWENGDDVTLITRPRRFGKTLTMNMVEHFFSVRYAGRKDLFEHFSIWEDERYRVLQGTYPVITLSFAKVKATDYIGVRKQIIDMLAELYSDYSFLLKEVIIEETDKEYFERVSYKMDDVDAAVALYKLSRYLYRFYGKRVIILLDEYDTPMQEAYVNGYWEELVAFTRNLFNSTFKTNPYLERGIMTGITRISKESVFSDLNNLEVVTTTSEKYMDSFGFTEAEVFAALAEFGLSEYRQEVKDWYDGFTFGTQSDIYNPWSILNYLDKKKFTTYWANTSSNNLAGKLIREGNKNVKQEFERLLRGETITLALDEQVVYNQLSTKKNAMWSLLLAGGYLKVESMEFEQGTSLECYHLAITNKEVRIMFENMVRDWFAESEDVYNDFIKALLNNDIKAMNNYMNMVALQTFSYFDSGKIPSRAEPERFYHGFVLGLIVELSGRYAVTSNRESGFGRYDVILEPLRENEDAYILEFKVRDPEDEKTLKDTVGAALNQIEEKKYDAVLLIKGIPPQKIRKYGFAFEGQSVLIG